ncbi:MAG TPA: mechanosensitive ion channel domain-containing protein [Stellaceae bacterium]|nr:mechanosensitive ion channel domain-containing protein [Stellaceae bacterium]
MQFLGIEWVGVDADTGRKFGLSIGFVLFVILLRLALRAIVGLVVQRSDRRSAELRFWTRQGISLFTAVLLIFGLLSIWFSDPARLATAFGLVSAGLAFALQRVITAIAGYVVILRGATFTVGDRISMGGVRGDVIALGFIQTTIMEMGEPPAVQNAEPPVWVRSRQFTGRIVTVSNAKIFDEPVFNYTRDFPYIWEEITVPIAYKADRKRAEQILLEAARTYALGPGSLSEEVASHLRARYGLDSIEFNQKVFYRLTDNWLELTVRFVLESHQTRRAKDLMSRYIIEKFDAAGIGIASATYDIVGLPPIRLEEPPARSRAAG